MTIHIRNILVHDDKGLTEAGDDFCARLYEHPAFAREGKPRCWHKFPIYDIFIPIPVIDTCLKCKERVFISINPSLLTDLNAVHELEIIIMRGDVALATELSTALYDNDSYNPLFAPAHIRAEALASVLTVECNWGRSPIYPNGRCQDGQISLQDRQPDMSGKPNPIFWQPCPACSGTGRVPILDAWEKRWREHDPSRVR